MLKQSELLGRARKHQEEARKIRKIFKDIAKKGNSIPSDGENLKPLLEALAQFPYCAQHTNCLNEYS